VQGRADVSAVSAAAQAGLTTNHVGTDPRLQASGGAGGAYLATSAPAGGKTAPDQRGSKVRAPAPTTKPTLTV
ncbi:MAG: hypothetical protein M3N52_05640, partial [Actinomycetota bacterium]|nr:hypothetical protein [Actinomycetota bacterium]